MSSIALNSTMQFALSNYNSFSGIAEVLKIKSVLNQLKELLIDSTTLEEFQTFFKYLAFVACAAKAPVRGKMLDETLSAISKAGTAENIEHWCWWTPNQLSLLEQAENLNRVILIGKRIEILISISIFMPI